MRLVELTGDAEITPANARFFANPFPVVLHILVVIPSGSLGRVGASTDWAQARNARDDNLRADG
ncbi:MAG: hypothetical protein ACT4PJ_08665 [Gemmatimonadaceae bacterium]